ncbi:hypothetical protein [Bradyrhizobium japonicum]|nr:hypothetical protein [Bradyrhizobium japonicum]WLB53905.1 hypothetical protein QIH94_43000 [Bradyrhizobium japonicum]
MKPHIGYFAKEALRIVKAKGDPSIPTLSPYIGRGLLEATLTALLFRLDPFRGLTLMRFQTHADFDHNRPNNISIDWNGDLLSNVEERADIWKPKQKPENVSRGLLSPYMDEVIWRPALAGANDSIMGIKSDFPHRLGKDPDEFINGIRGEARQLYSFWSKGIHGEFFAIGPHTLDELTCADRVRRTLDILLDLAFVSQFTYVSVGNVEPQRAYQLFSSAKETLHG